MDRKSPVMICRIKHNPSSDPKFHQVDRLVGAGRSTSALLAIRIAG
jgi:hypothetical protein